MITTNEELQMLSVFSRDCCAFLSKKEGKETILIEFTFWIQSTLDKPQGRLWDAWARVLKPAYCRVLKAALYRRALHTFALFVLTRCSELNTS